MASQDRELCGAQSTGRVARLSACPIVSVIATFYNCSDMAPTCVDSLLAQTFDCYEIVLVDDGSRDGTARVLDSYASRSGVRVVHKPNGGAADARNVGVRAASGAYLTFVDGDDLVGPRHLEFLYQTLVHSGAGMATVGHLVLSEADAARPSWADADAWSLFAGRDAVSELLYERIYEAPWAKLAPRSLYEEHPFPVGRAYEDVAISGMHVLAAESVARCDATTYGYVMHPASVVNRCGARIAQAEDFVWAIECMLDSLANAYGDLSDGVAYRRVLEYLRLHALLVRIGDDKARAAQLDCGIVGELRDLLPTVSADEQAARRTVWRARLLAWNPRVYDRALRLYERVRKQV